MRTRFPLNTQGKLKRKVPLPPAVFSNGFRHFRVDGENARSVFAVHNLYRKTCVFKNFHFCERFRKVAFLTLFSSFMCRQKPHRHNKSCVSSLDLCRFRIRKVAYQIRMDEVLDYPCHSEEGDVVRHWSLL